MTKGHRGGSGPARAEEPLTAIAEGGFDTDERIPLGVHDDVDRVRRGAARGSLNGDVERKGIDGLNARGQSRNDQSACEKSPHVEGYYAADSTDTAGPGRRTQN